MSSSAGSGGAKAKEIFAHCWQRNTTSSCVLADPNAGHKVADPVYTYRQLPSGTGSNKNARIFIAAGSTISLPTLLKELNDHPWLEPEGWLSVDPQAMIIEQGDIDIEEKLLEKISSTKQGVGSATARKVLGRGATLEWGPQVRLARDVEELKPYLKSVRVEIERALAGGQRIMLEGTQGTELSIHHGSYPHVTSRETSVAGCLSDAGVPYNRVRRAVLVARTYPIRVGGPSGPMGVEMTLSEIAKISGVPLNEIDKTEKGSVSGKTRRIAEIDWEKIRMSVYVNGATDIALTFVDYLGVENRSAKTFNDLSEKAQQFVRDVERVCGVSVSLISKDFGVAGLIDLREWK
ncbi:adenylosuccinate synthetase [Rhizobium sp. MHM7A]|uniref:adenylosuccinate synthetase n=1 Tax=Rhizobium sp. MHM7A TaxID=2583233 RepID=UPI002484D668|nr:adenylosuccinate synthetase [Rhizobium sp. MHM7A]